MGWTLLRSLHNILLLVMMKYIQIVALMFLPFTAWACNDINGTYKSVSETHWNFSLEINGGSARLVYTDYSSGIKDTRTDIEKVSKGYCEKNESDYILTFAERSLSIKHHEALSHSVYGAKGSSPGITGEFFEGQSVNLWLSQ